MSGRYFFLISGFILAFILTLNTPTSAFGQQSAQDNSSLFDEDLDIPRRGSNQPEREDNSEKMDLSDIPKEYFDEMAAFHEQCLGDAQMNTFFECDCLATKYFDKRVELGPLPNESEILLELTNVCRNDAAIAGSSYGRCMMMGSNIPADQEPENYCRCFGNAMAMMVREVPAANLGRVRVMLNASARQICNGMSLKNDPRFEGRFPHIPGITDTDQR